MAVRVTTEGLEELARRWGKVKKTSRENIEKALDKSADEFVAETRAICPVEHGELRDSIHKGEGRKPMSRFVMAGSDRPSKHGGTLHDEARLVEFGTMHSKANPFFLTTWRVRKKRYRGRVQRAINAAVKLQGSDGGE